MWAPDLAWEVQEGSPEVSFEQWLNYVLWGMAEKGGHIYFKYTEEKKRTKALGSL